jgi:REP element-mobilizing transposase RayT
MAIEEYFFGRFLNQSIRSPFWNYSSNGYYFLTLISFDRENLFGEIKEGIMNLSAFGKIVDQEWNISFKIRPELSCDIYIIMPDHIHAIVQIDGVPNYYSTNRNFSNCGIQYRQPKSISSFIAGFKSSATSKINRLRNTPDKPVWQSRFHDHVIRNQDDYNQKYNYILQNPLK